jgi:beta-phosphoglucomutase-like phosphatase (HAD superfamily)
VLLLFDIDGTLLLKATRAHAQAVVEAVRGVYGAEERPEVRIEAAGRTDPGSSRCWAASARSASTQGATTSAPRRWRRTPGCAKTTSAPTWRPA